MKYLIGQRVIIDNNEIATVIAHPQNARIIERESTVWVLRINGVGQWRSIDNVKPLPNGQL
jgi:hypothetical protein